MSPQRRVERHDYITALLGLLEEGTAPTAISQNQFARRLNVSKTQIYGRFGSWEEFLAEGRQAWQDSGDDAMLTTAMESIRDPADRIRWLAQHLRRRSAARRGERAWALSDPLVATRVAELDTGIFAHVNQALTELGYGPDDAAALGRVLMQAMAGEEQVALPAQGGVWDRVLDVLSRPAG
jgi:hypothetical protein